MRHRTRMIAALAPLMGLLVWPLGSAPAGAASVDLTQWPGRLNSVSTVSSNHAWAVGTNETSGFLLYWDGSRWRERSLVLPGRASELDAIDARTANDIWLVGYYFPDSSGRQVTLIEHWDGSGWHQEPSPGPTRSLTSVSADSQTDAWAAGFGPHGSVLLHWDGVRWTEHGTQGLCCRTIRGLKSVTAISPEDAWAVGYTGGRVSTFMTMHWDGVSWQRVQSALPSGRKVEGELESVSATSATDVWAVGDFITADVKFRSFIEHWDGSDWTRVPSLNRQEPDGAIPYGTAAVSPGDAWTVGYRLRPSRTVTDHWNGHRRTDVESPDPGLLFAVDASSSSNAWAVGGRMNRTLIEHWDSHTWSVS